MYLSAVSSVIAEAGACPDAWTNETESFPDTKDM
jgi:hypothetical protein